MIISVNVPESLVIMAFGQWCQARKPKEAWRKSTHISEEKENALRMEGAYFIVIGGIFIDKFPKSQPESKNERRWLKH